MSLNFDFTAVIKRLGQEEFAKLTSSPYDKDKWHPVTNALIWGSLAVGLGDIKEDNVDEWSFRLRLLQLLGFNGTLEYNDGSSIQLTRKDVENHIGMRTNVTNEKRNAWLSHVVKSSWKPIELAKEGSAFEEVAKRFAAAETETKT